MARRYGAGVPIEVLRRDEEPAGFVRGRRHYQVRSVLAHWVEARPWWVGLESAGQAEREVWRVEASVDHGEIGVYDLQFDWSSGRWSLAGVLD
jgi:hypothetical protein